MKVLIDVDDTISETQTVLLKHINEELGADFTYDEMTRAHRAKEFAHNADSKTVQRVEKWGNAVRGLLKRPDVMATCEPCEGALDAMIDLYWSGYDLHIVSSRQDPLHRTTEEWLIKHGFRNFIEQIHPRPSDERGTDFKVRVAREQRFGLAFDDTFEVCAALAEVVPVVYLIDRPWNRGHDDELPDNVTRVDSFQDGVRHYLAQSP
jgi:uncharacterized HAD superfamily protein